MDQTENEFGIPYKEPEMKTEKQKDAEQPASGEQPKDNDDSMLREYGVIKKED